MYVYIYAHIHIYTWQMYVDIYITNYCYLTIGCLVLWIPLSSI